MNYTNLGKTGLKVSRICLGCMSYGLEEREWGLDEEQGRPFIKRALERLRGPSPSARLRMTRFFRSSITHAKQICCRTHYLATRPEVAFHLDLALLHLKVGTFTRHQTGVWERGVGGKRATPKKKRLNTCPSN